MLEPVSVALKFGFLAVLYLFLLWVARAALKDLRARARRDEERRDGAGAPPADATGFHAASDLRPAGRTTRAIRASSSSTRRGTSRGIELRGRRRRRCSGGATSEIRLEDPFASSRHARIVAEGAVHGHRGPRLDERHLPERRAARRARSRCTPATASASATPSSSTAQ